MAQVRKLQVNGTGKDHSNGSQSPTKQPLDHSVPESGDAAVRLEAMSQEREALRAEVEQLRKSLENIQEQHVKDIAAARLEQGDNNSSVQTQNLQAIAQIKDEHKGFITKLEAKHTDEVAKIQAEHTEELSAMRTELEETESAREQAESQYQALLGRINSIKASLGERLKADKEELATAREQIEELEAQNEELQKRVEGLESAASRTEDESKESSKELSSLRNRHNLAQQNWVSEREDLLQQTRHLREEAEAAKEAMGDWEVLAMEERSNREALIERVRDLEEQFSAQKEAYEETVSERDSQSSALSGLQKALQEVQETRKRELREMVESYEEQVQSLKKLVQQSDARSVEAEASKNSLQAELDRLVPFEKEVKEKNLLIGKLRHEAIVLNDHLTKALRFLKKAKPEDNIDRYAHISYMHPPTSLLSLKSSEKLLTYTRQIVTNHFLQFLALDRSDPKKFQILQIIAALLNWTDEQKEQAGLARPGTSSSSLRLPQSPFHRTPSTPSLSSEFFTDSSATKESLADLWTGFLERSAEEGSQAGTSRAGSVSGASVAGRPGTSAGR